MVPHLQVVSKASVEIPPQTKNTSSPLIKDPHFNYLFLELTQMLFSSNTSMKAKASYKLLAMVYAESRVHLKVDWTILVTKKAPLQSIYDLCDIVDTYVPENKHHVTLETSIIPVADDGNIGYPRSQINARLMLTLKAIGVVDALDIKLNNAKAEVIALQIHVEVIQMTL